MVRIHYKNCVNIFLDELHGVRYLNPPHLLTMQNSKAHRRGEKRAVQDSIIENLPRHSGSPAD